MRKFFVFLAALIYAGIISAPLMQVRAATIKGTDCVVNGESFFQASNICSELSRLARADGILASGDNFKQIAVSGASISQILSFYKNCNPKPTYLISDGAGIDLMSGNCSDENCSKIQSCKNTLLQYLDAMKTGETKKLLWMIYPDPQGGNWATLKKNQDIWAQVVPKVMANVTEPKVLLVDLRESWAGHYNQYTSDGIHCTSAGGTATAEAFWKAMKESNFFEITPVDVPYTIANVAPSSILTQLVGNGNVAVSLSVGQPSNIMLHLTTVSGRSVLTMERQAPVSGLQTVEFPLLGAIARGIYCCEVRAGRLTAQSTLLVP